MKPAPASLAAFATIALTLERSDASPDKTGVWLGENTKIVEAPSASAASATLRSKSIARVASSSLKSYARVNARWGRRPLRIARYPTRSLTKLTRWLLRFAQSSARDQAGQMRSASRAPAL